MTSRSDTVPAELRLPAVPSDWQADPQRTKVDMTANGIQDLYLAYQQVIDGEVEQEVLVCKHPVHGDCYVATVHETTGRVKDPSRRNLTTECTRKEVLDTWPEARDWALDYLHSATYGDE